MKRATVLSLAVLSAVLACQSDRSVAPNPAAPHSGISTALVDGGHGGNPHFFFLPPMVPPPHEDQPPPFSGTFDGGQTPVVQICTITPNGVCSPVASFTTPAVGTPFDPTKVFTRVQVVPPLQLYFVLWQPDWLTLDPTAIRRVTVSVGGQALGIADIQVVGSLAEAQAVWAGKQFVPLLKGGLLLIIFRIEQGALGTGGSPPQCNSQPDCLQVTVGPNTQRLDVVTPSGQAAVSFPPGYFNETVTLTIHQVPTGCFSQSNPPTPIVDFGCYSYTTSPPVLDPLNCQENRTASTCARVEVCPTIAQSDPRYFHLHLFKSDPDQPVRELQGEVAATLVTCGPPRVIGRRGRGVGELARASWRTMTNALSRLVQPKPLMAASAMMIDGGLGGLSCCFSNIGFALPLSIFALTPTTAYLAAGGWLPVSVRLQAAHFVSTTPVPLDGIPVTFTVTQGGGTVTAQTITTGTDGVASTQWLLGAGSNSLRVTAGGPSSPVMFAATGLTGLLLRPVNQNLAGTPLPLTQPSGLSMQHGVGVQLEYTPTVDVTVAWSSSDLFGTIASVNTTGGVAVVQGNEDPNAAKEVTFSATAGTIAGGSIKLNSFTFGHFPRWTTLVWRPVTGAASYEVHIQSGQGGCTATTAGCTVWVDQFTTPPTTTSANNGFVFGFVGAQPGRWWVVAKNADGGIISTSEITYFRFII
jgi:hypothetical protein